MIGKVIIFAFSTLLLCEATTFIEKICPGPDSANCQNNAKKCMIPINLKGEALDAAHAKACKVFKTCLEEGGAVPTFHKYVKEKQNGKDVCSSKPDDHKTLHQYISRPMMFLEYLTQALGPEAANKFRCCQAKAMGWFGADGKPHVPIWKEHALKIVDPSAKAAYEAGIDSCAKSEHVCSEIQFARCIIEKCSNAIKAH